MSTDVTTPITEPQKIFDRNMDAPIKKIEMSWATNEATKLRLGVRPTRQGWAGARPMDSRLNPGTAPSKDCMQVVCDDRRVLGTTPDLPHVIESSAKCDTSFQKV